MIASQNVAGGWPDQLPVFRRCRQLSAVRGSLLSEFCCGDMCICELVPGATVVPRLPVLPASCKEKRGADMEPKQHVLLLLVK
jgi:hypothetical protein